MRLGRGERCFSELTFSNLFLFRAVHEHRPVQGPWPGIAGIGYDGARYLLPLFDPIDVPAFVLRQLMADHGYLYPLDEHQAHVLVSRGFISTQCRNDADYLYQANQFLDYPGRALAKKRNQVRQLLAKCNPTALPYGLALEGVAHEVLSGWMTQKGKISGEADEDACLEALSMAEQLRLQGFVYFDGERPIGFILGQILEPGVIAIRFAKGLDSYAGIYPYMFSHLSRQFEVHFGHPVHWMNFEQDMGNVGMRRSKMSFMPTALVAKWRVSLAPEMKL